MTEGETRSIVHEEVFPASSERLFDLLIRPSAVRSWWQASRMIVMPRTGGLWMAVWGDEDDPDFVTAARLRVFEPPHRLVMADYVYHAKSGPLPFAADFETTFEIEPEEGGSRLRVTQRGFPHDAAADEFYAGCEQGWRDTFAGIRRFLVEH